MRGLKSVLFFGFFLSGLAAAPLDYKVFSSESYIFYIQKSGIFAYSRNSKDFRNIILNEGKTEDEITDVSENDGILWLLTPEGVYMLDMGSNTVEKIPFLSDNACNGRITADMDFVWLACSDTLMKFDQLGREWLSYPIDKKGAAQDIQILNVESNGSEVYCAFPGGVHAFYMTDEKWKSYPLPEGRISDSAKYVSSKENLLMIDGTTIFRFLIETRSWEQVKSGEPVIDALIDASANKLYYLTLKNAYSYELSSSISRRFEIKSEGPFAAFDKAGDSAFYIAADGKFLVYDDVNRITEYLPPNEKASRSPIEKVSTLGDVMLAISGSQIDYFYYDNKLWQVFSRRKLDSGKKLFTWNDDGAAASYGRGYKSTLKGYVDQLLEVKAEKKDEYTADSSIVFLDSTGTDTVGFGLDTGRVTDWSSKREEIKADLTLHNQFPEGRYLDVTFSNIRPKDPPIKGMQYRGNPNDWVQDGILGQHTFHIPDSKTLPDARFHGAAIVAESPAKLKNRDRKKMRVSAGAGLANSRKVKKVIPYNPSPLYQLFSDDIVRFDVSRYFRIVKNGRSLENSHYLLDWQKGTVSFPRTDTSFAPSDKFIIEYKVRTVIDNFHIVHTLRDEFTFPALTRKHTLNKEIIRIIPGTLTISIDGEEIDPMLYTFVASTGTLNFQRDAGLEPSSVIIAEYEVETIPEEGVRHVELLPENNYGAMGYVDANYNFTDWLGTRVSFVPAARDTGGTNVTPYQLAHVSVPIELRRKNIFLEVDPEFTHDAANNANGAGLGLNSRLGKKTSFGFKALVTDTALISTNSFSSGYGLIEKDLDVTAAYDVFDNWTLAYRYDMTRATRGANDRYELSSDLHVPRFPFLNVSVSRNILDADIVLDSLDTLLSTASDLVYSQDTIDIQKDRIKTKIYETSSPYLEKLLRFNKIGYEISLTEFFITDYLPLLDTVSGGWDANERDDHGRILFSELVLSPISSITYSVINTFNQNPEGSKFTERTFSASQLQTIDAPPGIELGANYSISFDREVTLESKVNLERSLSLIIKPGTWYRPLAWFSPRGSISQTIEKEYPSHPGMSKVILGETDTAAYSLSRVAGVHIFPSEDIFFENKNTWENRVDEPATILNPEIEKKSFKSLNDLKLWFNSKRALWQTRWELVLNKDSAGVDSSWNQKGYSRYDNTWKSWLRSSQGLAFTYDRQLVKKGLAGTVVDTTALKIGPTFTLSFNFQDYSIIKKFLNNHSLYFNWYYINAGLFSGLPEVAYSKFLRINFKPNLFLTLRTSFVLVNDKAAKALEMETFLTQLNLQAYF